MRIDDFLAHLEGSRRSGKNWAGRCPGHDDHHFSLSVGEGADLRILLKDHAGCTPEAIVAALGLRMADLMPEKPKPQSRKRAAQVVATYQYKDADGTLLYEVQRKDDKSFSQRRPDGNGGWIYKLDGVKRVPYRLPELLAADPSINVYAPEGEKDVENIVAQGLPATTNSGGVEGWQTGLADHFRGRRVVVLPDNDVPGRKLAKEKARSLFGVAASVKVLDLPGLPEKGDVSDWLAAGGTAQDLQRLAAEAPEWSPPSPASLSALLDALVAFICRFVVMTKHQAAAWALWVAHTHALDAAEQTPYLSITSAEKRSGKTLVLEISELVVARPWLTGRVSAAALVRKVDKDRPSLLLDESDAAFNGEKDYAEALRGLLNTGHRRNGRASLCVGQGAALDVRDFSTFCPKVIAGIGQLPDTVADRSIPIRLQRKAQEEKAERFREKKVRQETSLLKAQLEAWATSDTENLKAAEPELPDELSARAQDGAEPLLAIADLAGDAWPTRARNALKELFAAGSPEDDSLGVRLLRDCQAVFEAHPDADRLGSAELLKALTELEESPWLELNKGKPLTARGLARLLNPYGITSGSVRLGDKTPKGYYRVSFKDAWSRYLPPSGLPSATTPQANTGAGFPDFSKRHTDNPVADQKREIVNADADCGAVADKPPVSGGGEAIATDTDEEAAML